MTARPEARAREEIDCLDARAAAGGGANDYQRFAVVADLLRETVGTPELRASLYRFAAGLDGVELIGSATDRAGRTGPPSP